MTRSPRPARRLLAATVLPLLLAVASACSAGGAGAGSGSGSGPGQAVDPVRDAATIDDPGHRPDARGVAEVTAVIGPALARGDGKRACSLMARSAQDRLVALAGGENCVDGTTALAATLAPSDRADLEGLQATRVSVSGTSATAVLSGRSAAVSRLFGPTPGFLLSEERWALR